MSAVGGAFAGALAVLQGPTIHTSQAPARSAPGQWRAYVDRASGTLLLSVNGSDYIAIATGSAFANPMTALGDLIVGLANGAPGRLGIGLVGQVPSPVNGTPAWVNGVLVMFKNTGTVSINNTNVETTMLGAGVGSLVVSGGTAAVGTTFKIRFGFRLTSTNTGGATFKLYWGAIIIYTRTTPPWNGANIVLQGEIILQVLTIGAAATARIQWSIPASTNGSIVGNAANEIFDEGAQQNTFDTTTDQSLNLTFQWGNSTQTGDVQHLDITKQ